MAYTWINPEHPPADLEGSHFGQVGSPVLTPSGDSVRVTWSLTRWGPRPDHSSVYTSLSADAGETWNAAPVHLATQAYATGAVCAAASGSRVQVAWEDNWGGDLHLVRSADQGATWDAPVNLDLTLEVVSGTSAFPRMVAAGDRFYIGYRNNRWGTYGLYVRRRMP